MARLKYRELGSVLGVCACCYADVDLRLTESKLVRTWRDQFDRSFVSQVQRTASCSSCGSTYPLRSSDLTPVPAAKRTKTHKAPRAPKRSTDPATLSTGRDWRDTGVRV